MILRMIRPSHSRGIKLPHVPLSWTDKSEIQGPATPIRRLLIRAAAYFLLSIGSAAAGEPECVGPPLPSMYEDRGQFDRAIDGATVSVRLRVGGITVPHHLTAADLIANTFGAVEADAFDKIILLFPDHFRRARKPFATTMRPFETVYGLVCTEAVDAAWLLENQALFQESDLFARDHGIGALLPFVRRFFPDIPILPIAIAINSQRHHWDQLVEVLSRLVTERTLIIQSTDFSHYLSEADARIKDQITLNVIAASDADAVARLSQPTHLDSPGSQYVQMRLQAMRSADPIVLFHSNSQQYSDEYEQETTSYVAQVYPRGPVGRVLPSLKGSRIFCFVGDFFVGRFWAPLLRRPELQDALVGRLGQVLGDCPVILNLEGVFGAPRRARASDRTLVMAGPTALSIMRRLNVNAASLANNHSDDLGSRARQRTASGLRKAGIIPLERGKVADLEFFRLVALNDLGNPFRSNGRVSQREITAIRRSATKPPLVAFLHWGREFTDEPDEREEQLAIELARSGVGLVTGAHSHRASRRLRILHGGASLLAYSLGNFVFDQPFGRSSGAILELRVFDQGTFFARLVPIPNVFRDTLQIPMVPRG